MRPFLLSLGLVTLACAHCGGEDATTGGAGGGGAAGSGGTGGARCDVAAPFSMPEPVDEVSTPGTDWCPRLSWDELELYVTADADGTSDLIRFDRGSTAEPFKSPGTPLSALNTTDYDGCAFVSTDGLELFYDRKAAGGQSDMYVATRASADAQFADPQPLDSLNTAESEWYPWMSGDELFYVATRNGVTSLHSATRNPDGSFGAGAPLTELHEEGAAEFGPTLPRDGLTIYFNRDKPGENEIWRATRATRDAPFGDPVRVAELNTSNYESPGWISEDGCTIYLDSNRSAAGDWNIYRASRPMTQ